VTRSRPLPRSFYARDAGTVARDLLGTILVHRTGKLERRARVVETEAYVGAHDLACHASKGRTGRTEVMFGRAGHAYVYLIYGMYDMLNVVTGEIDHPEAVLIRAAEPIAGVEGSLRGPGKLARGMAITRAENGIDLCKNVLFFLPGRAPDRIEITPRIGVDYAGDWKDAELRFFDADSPEVSRRPKPARRRG
jgi:DNA-3-methyladenine glycosylase